MAVKTITIDMDAYRLLSAEKRGNESFSKVIKRRLRPACTAASLLEALPSCALSDESLDDVDAIIKSRSDSSAKSEAIDSGV